MTKELDKKLSDSRVINVPKLLFALCFAFIMAYIINFDLFIGGNKFVRSAFNYAFPTFLIICIFVSYGLYATYSTLVRKTFKKSETSKVYYGPIISAFIGFFLVLFLYFKSSVYMKLFLNRTSDQINYHQLAWDLNSFYLPKIFILIFVLIFVIDFAFFLLKFKHERIKGGVALLFADCVFAFLTILSIALLYALQLIVTLIIGGGGIA